MAINPEMQMSKMKDRYRFFMGTSFFAKIIRWRGIYGEKVEEWKSETRCGRVCIVER
jgi:hypothetical protein